MDDLTLSEFASIVQGEAHEAPFPGGPFANVSIDSRRVPKSSAFFALKGGNTDGHNFVTDALNNGAVTAVISRRWMDARRLAQPAGPLVVVADPLQALQQLAAWWRGRLSAKVIGITGSNGKTIVKDALIQILSASFSAAGSPGSFNSQVGVPLSVVRLVKGLDFAVLEAGVSASSEMDRLESIIRPDFGILTNIGLAHIAAFGARAAIAAEKAKLFRNLSSTSWILAPAGDSVVETILATLDCRVYRFGGPSEEIPFIESFRPAGDHTALTMRFPDGARERIIVDTSSPEIHSDIEIAAAAAFLLGAGPTEITAALSGYAPGVTRMEVWRSPAGFTLINDSCSSDPISVRAALHSLATAKQDGKRIFVFGGMRELGTLAEDEHAQAGVLAAESRVDTLVLVGGEGLDATATAFQRAAPGRRLIRCRDSEQVKASLLLELQWGDTVLVKGPRNTGIDRAALEIIEAMAPNRFTVDLQSVSENLTRFQRLVGPQTRILAMVKALAYGSDATRLSLGLQRLGVEYVGVSTTDEGSALRRAGVDLPILVMMCTPDEAEKAARYRLTPVVYSFELVDYLARAAAARGEVMEVHLEVDTGMNRLGVTADQAPKLAGKIQDARWLKMVGLMTHFASADDPARDDFTRLQISKFDSVIRALGQMGRTDLIRHATATAGAARFPEARYDMVRIGLGMYGIYPSESVAKEIELDLAVSLVSRIVEIRELRKGDRIGYGGTFEVPADGFRMGVIPIGYHDGIPLAISNRGSVKVNGQMAPIVGRISMDSSVVDISGIDGVEPGADVLIFGKHAGFCVRPEEVAGSCSTIPYELLARLGPRIQRIFTG